ILDRMAEHGTEIKRVINAGGIPQNNPVLNQVYANCLGRPVLVPAKKVVGLGSAIFAFLAAGTFASVEEAQAKVCPPHTRYEPDKSQQKVYEQLYPLFRKLYFAFGAGDKSPMSDVLPQLIRTAKAVNKNLA
ncbi:MAG TPA: FGGY-family carbohydrate kinase, partial [Candidatus Binatia bacterium]|nr:FGGY-family carbohydrate kinase [Candidatus Binatia bacterium]